MKFVPQSFTRTLARQVFLAKKNSPHIFFVGGVVGLVGGAVLACRATLKLGETLDEIKVDLDKVQSIHPSHEMDQQQSRELIGVYASSALKIGKLYGPSIAVGVVSVAALTGSHVQLTRRNAALTAFAASISKMYDDYRGRVREAVGEERELEIYRCMEDVEIEVDGKKKIVQKVGKPGKWSLYAKVFDEFNENWVRDQETNRYFIQCQQNYFNQRLQAHGHVFLNEVYDHLGFSRTTEGQVVGWLRSGDGDGFIDFDMFEPMNAGFINGVERSVILDFNVDGIIYDKI